MPPTPVPADLVRIQLVHEIADGPELVTNTLHLKLVRQQGDSTDWPALTQEAANKVRDKYLGGGRPLGRLSSSLTLRAVKAYHLDAATGLAIHKAEATGVPISGYTGGGAAAMLPPDVAAVVSLRTLGATEVLADPDTGPSPMKQSRGRIFVGGIPASAVAPNGRMTTTFRDGLADDWEAFLNDVTGMTAGGGVSPNTWDVVVLSKKAVATRKVQEIVVDDLFDTQRRRSNRQAPNRTRRVINP